MKNKKTWTVILSSSADMPVRQFRLPKLLLYFSIFIIFLLVITIAGLTFVTNTISNEKEELLVKLEKRNDEITEVKQNYHTLQQEALTVQETIEEFKIFEERLSNLDLEIPAEVDPNNPEGSGGMEMPIEKKLETDISTDLTKIQKELPDLIQKFENTLSRLSDYENELRTIPTIIPTAEGRITSKFGNRKDPFNSNKSFHNGIDIAAPLDTPIYAAADGKVIRASENGGYGLFVHISHNETYETFYAHLNHISVNVGDIVKKGDVIGGMGTTGRSTGVHLHYEIKRNGEFIDPYLYMTFHERINNK